MLTRLRRMWRGASAQFKGIAANSEASAHRLKQLSSQMDQLQRETRLLLGALSLPPADVWRSKPPWMEGAPATSAFSRSTMCRQDSFEQAYFPYWTRRVGSALSYHRKLWEHVFICQALWERGAIRSGAKALGFGVGREPLTAFFAAEGCEVTATDLAPETAAEKGWTRTAQHAPGLEALRHLHVCSDEQFDRNVTFRVCDMNDIPPDLTEFDLCWSACALEHLGSIERGLAFIERSVDCLKPGGWAVHTTEFNVSSNGLTVEEGGTVLFRRRDLEELEGRLRAKGHQVAPFDFDPGLMPLDRYIDVAPYRAEPHLKVALAGFAATSFGIIVQKAPEGV
jgi:2-polyprenyl-3-methyl-5-hydroxy-6-metoxy-1,4-benzoquinol methylase